MYSYTNGHLQSTLTGVSLLLISANSGVDNFLPFPVKGPEAHRVYDDLPRITDSHGGRGMGSTFH